MNEIINRILDGKFEYDNGSLDFSRSKIELTLMQGESYEGSFTIIGSKDRIIEGYIYSSDSRMKCMSEHFSGTTEEVSFVFDGNGLEEGDVIKGNFHIISNQGEYTLPFSVMISHFVLDSSLGSIKNLFHFTNLAKSNWLEAVQLFYSPDFHRIFSDNDKKYYSTYLGLSKQYFDERNVEEFLIAVHKKDKVNFIIDEDKIRLEEDRNVQRHEVLITRNGWGYTYLEIEAVGDFLRLEKDCLTDDDFIGNRCMCYYYVDYDKVHSGVNYGELHFKNTSVDIHLPIEMRPREAKSKTQIVEKEKQKLTAQIMEYYGAFRMKKISTKTWLQKNYELIENWIEYDDTDPEPKLFHAHLLMTEERYNEAVWVLEHAKNAIMQSKDMSSAIWCYYLYLNSLRNRDENFVNKIAKEVGQSYEMEPNNWRIAWLLLYLSPEYSTSYVKKWLFIKKQFERGCNSPVFYIEALLLMRLEPSLFMQLDEFEIQTLLYAAKHDLLTDDMLMQLHYLLPRMKEYSPRLFKIMKYAYAAREDDETLQCICSMLVKGGKIGKEYFKYYEAGIKKNLRITRLYEYYMESLDLQAVVEIPKMVYMYFSYNNALSYEQCAYLYASLVRMKQEYSDLYEAQQFKIEEFTLRMIREGRINKDLAYLYKEIVTAQMLDEELAMKLSKLVYTCQINVSDERMRRIVVYHPMEIIERRYEINNNIAMVPLYGDDYTILFEDIAGNRYATNVTYEIQRLIQPGRMTTLVTEADKMTISLQVSLCGIDRYEQEITTDNVERIESIIYSEEVQQEYRQILIPKLIQFYYDQDQIERLDAFLEKLHPAELTSVQRIEIIRFMVLRGYLEKASEWILAYGIGTVDPKTIVRLAKKMIEKQMTNPMLGNMCLYGFERGKYDLTTLQYLMEHFEGNTKTLRNIWKAAVEKELDVHALSEKILKQMLYTGCFVGEKMDIFKKYISGPADLSLEIAFLSQNCYDYFVKDKLMNEVVFEDVQKLLLLGKKLQKVCLLAYTKYFAEHKDKITQIQRPLLKRCLKDLTKEGCVLAYFADYADMFPFMTKFMDKTIIEYKTKPGTKAIIHYMIEHKENKGGEYHTMEMKDMYGGVCCSLFVLFFGEKLFYYITEERDGNAELTESDSVSRNDIGHAVVSTRFEMLNDVVISETLQDYEAVNQMLLEYTETDYLQNALFELR